MEQVKYPEEVKQDGFDRFLRMVEAGTLKSPKHKPGKCATEYIMCVNCGSDVPVTCIKCQLCNSCIKCGL